ncbi:MAG: Do family serine endopeptidase [Muribaculaceae bacterium]|nr:Do family serine endopeptidase [Muribaculaceae bacterium]
MKKVIISIIITAAVCVGVSVLRAESNVASDNKPTESTPATSDTRIAGRYISQDDFTRTAEHTVNGVVSVKSFATPHMQQAQADPYASDPFFEFFFGSPRGRRVNPQQPQEQPKQRQMSLGSGVIISRDGYIVTNNHVVADAERLEVTLNDNRNFDATIVGTDPSTDLALIKIDAPDLHVIPMGNSDDLRVGEWVLAVGNPFGFTSSVTSGIVSAKARNISMATGARPSGGIEAYIQTDAALNSGNSGGALVNLDGELVGINTAIYSQTGTYAGCSFAIPTSIVKKVVADLKNYGVVQRAYLGISYQEVTPELVQQKDIKGTASGIYVAAVEDRSAAREAGLQEGDVIVALNNHPIRNSADMQEAVTGYSPGDDVTITFYRDGKQMKATVKLRNNRGGTAVTRAEGENPLGASFAAISADTARSLEISNGVEVTAVEPDGAFAEAGIRSGFIILNINGTAVGRADDITSIYKAIKNGPSSLNKVLFITGIYPSGKAAYFAVPIED